MSKKISIIIPVFNGEKHIARCIDSIFAQEKFSLDDLEIILLNDGSTDNSLEILDTYSERCPDSIKVFSHKNMGIAGTRNKGIHIATGDYLMFVDQDDWIESDYCHSYYEAIHQNRLDIVSGGYNRPDKTGRSKAICIPDGAEYSRYLVVAPWAKIHRASFVKQNKITFFDNKFGEDLPFSIKEIALTDRWAHLPSCSYNWYFNEKSVSNTVQRVLSRENEEAILRLLVELREAGRTLEGSPEFQYFMLKTAIFYLLFSGRSSSPDNFISLYQRVFEWLEGRYPAILKSPKVIQAVNCDSTKTKLTVSVFTKLHRVRLVPAFSKLYCSHTR